MDMPVSRETVAPPTAASSTTVSPAAVPEAVAPQGAAPESASPATPVPAAVPSEKDAVIARLREVAARLGKTTLTRDEFVRASSTGAKHLDRYFSAWSEVCACAGLTPLRRRHPMSDAEIFAGLRRAFLAHGAIGTKKNLGRHLPFSISLVERRFGTWNDALAAFRRALADDPEPFPLLAALDRKLGFRRGPPPAVARPGPHPPAGARAESPRVWPEGDGGVVGELIDFRGMMRAPVNEMGVVALFALCAKDLGFQIDSIVRDFPDCHACRRVGPGRWQWVRIEFEFLSRNFLAHDHPIAGCDVIVCWENNWGDECPLEVIVLKDEIRKLREKEGR